MDCGACSGTVLIHNSPCVELSGDGEGKENGKGMERGGEENGRGSPKGSVLAVTSCPPCRSVLLTHLLLVLATEQQRTYSKLWPSGGRV